ncbi:MAG: hypothetical protein ACLRVN_07235 [Butyricicoccus sp.]
MKCAEREQLTVDRPLPQIIVRPRGTRITAVPQCVQSDTAFASLAVISSRASRQSRF